MLDDAAAAHRLLDVLRALAVAAMPLIHRGRGRPPIDDNDPQAVLANPRRLSVYELIEQRPGIPESEVKEILGMGGGVFDNHLNRLLRAGLVETRRSGRFVRLYLAGKAPPESDPSLLPETTKEVARAVLRHHGRTTGEIAQEVQLSAARVREHMRVLVAASLVRSIGGGRQVRHEPTDRLRAVAEEW